MKIYEAHKKIHIERHAHSAVQCWNNTGHSQHKVWFTGIFLKDMFYKQIVLHQWFREWSGMKTRVVTFILCIHDHIITRIYITSLAQEYASKMFKKVEKIQPLLWSDYTSRWGLSLSKRIFQFHLFSTVQMCNECEFQLFICLGVVFYVNLNCECLM